jgi:hypothetical protein
VVTRIIVIAIGAVAVAHFATSGGAQAQNGANSGDKWQYNLFNPTPEAKMRDFSTDRPDTTESPFTVDAGHIQFETTLFGFAKSRPDVDGAVTKSYEIGTTNIRLGLTNNAEFNLVWQPYGAVRTRDPVMVTRMSGIGGLTLRAKVNLWGNDDFEKSGATALALLPYVSIPTARNGIGPEHVEGGLIVPLSVKLNDKFTLGLMTVFDVVKNDGLRGYHVEFVNSASLSYAWTEKFSTYYEVMVRTGTRDPRGEVVMLGTGFTYELKKNLQLDAGVNVGITRAADVINPFVGISMRF